MPINRLYVEEVARMTTKPHVRAASVTSCTHIYVSGVDI